MSVLYRAGEQALASVLCAGHSPGQHPPSQQGADHLRRGRSRQHRARVRVVVATTLSGSSRKAKIEVLRLFCVLP